jgi:hypothetical protein
MITALRVAGATLAFFLCEEQHSAHEVESPASQTRPALTLSTSGT